MLDDFFVRALIGAIGLAIAAAPPGCVVVWQRMAYFGETLAHSSLLGVALAFAFTISMTLSVFLVSVSVAVILLLLQRRQLVPGDALLGILSHASLAGGLVILSFLPQIRQDLSAYLFGDILSVSRADIALIWLGGAAALAALARLWRPLIAATVSDALAQAEGLRPRQARAAFMLLLALIIAAAVKLIGILLIGALLIIPAAAARRLAATPEKMAGIAVIIAIAAAISGLYASYYCNTPSGPSIVLAAFILFVLTLLPFSQISAFIGKNSQK